MKRGIFFSLIFLSASALLLAEDPPADKAYSEAQACYQSLNKKNSKGWDACIRRFQNIAQSPKALFSAGRLAHEKQEITQSKQDLETVFRLFNDFLRRYPKDPLADDALFRIARLRFEAMKETEKAKRALSALLVRYPTGDMAEPAAEYLKKLEGGQTPVITVPTTGPAPTDAEDKNIKVIVIDPGHGGEDTGAVGKKGTKESVVTLQIARKLAFQLKKELGVDVFLTRTNHKALSLEERNQLASAKKADLFISIHANANPSRKLSGVQTFYLNNASSEAASRLAERENKATKGKMSLSDRILSTMLQNANTDDSRSLAHAVQKTLVHRLRRDYPDVADLNVDSALFYVLVGAKCPSILVETSFLSHPEEELRLKATNYQWAIADGVAQGVKHFSEKSQGGL